MKKLTSRKFWLSVAGIIGGIGTAIAGMTTDNQTIVIAGIICASLSNMIYTICESYVDAAAVDAQIVTVVDNTDGVAGEEEAEEE